MVDEEEEQWEDVVSMDTFLAMIEAYTTASNTHNRLVGQGYMTGLKTAIRNYEAIKKLA